MVDTALVNWLFHLYAQATLAVIRDKINCGENQPLVRVVWGIACGTLERL